MKQLIKSWKDCRDDAKVRKQCRAAGYEVREAPGSHFVISGPGGSMTGYHGEQSTGVAVKQYKWMKAVGIILLLCGMLKVLV